MPIYNTHCPACSKDTTQRLSFQEFDQVVSGTVSLSCDCGGSPALVFDPSAVSFVLKDGESGGWVSKAQRENRYRATHRQEMGRRERDHVKPNKLIPNHNGQVAGSWSEAKDAAYQSTYERVNREHGARTAASAASEAAKTYDTHVKKEAS